jgi:response regulator of citrate/malate metabolism
MKVKTSTSTKSKLIKVISKKFIIDYLFKPMNTFEVDFQEELDKYLKFETKVCNVFSKNDSSTSVDILFDDTGTKKGITFIVEKS